jgi:carboxymethylenebutenolidase
MTQLTNYLYAAGKVAAEDKALIILPEIYGVQDFTRELAAKVQSELGWTSYVLDHFYAETGKAQIFDYDDAAPGMAIMQKMTGEKYLTLLDKALAEVQKLQPHVARIAIWGFCFGGKLAYVSGVDRRVTDIVSFYGGASLEPGFYQQLSSFWALIDERHHDDALRIFAAYGRDDAMIPATDVATIQDLLEKEKIQHEVRLYNAGHAFFNEDRTDRYDATAAQKAWADVRKFLQA